MNADLQDSLIRARKTVASVTTQNQANSCIFEATDYWIRKHLGQPWTVISVDLTLATNIVQAVSAKTVTKKDVGILQNYSFHSATYENLLIVYSSDKYTEAWVHETLLAAARTPNSRILNVERNDPGELIDLGDVIGMKR